MIRRLWQMLTAAVLALVGLSLPVSTIVNEGCTVKTDTVFVHDTTNISATFVCFIKSYEQKAFLFSDPIADLTVSKVKVEWDTNSFDMVKELDDSYLFFFHAYFLPSRKTYKVTLTSNIGGCQGTCVIPDTTYIIQPVRGDTFRVGYDILTVWRKVQNASFYYLYFYICSFDNFGFDLGTIRGDTFVVDTTFTLPASFFSNPNAAYYDVGLYVFTLTGPVIRAGATSNMQGFVKGFLYGGNTFSYTYFYVGTPLINRVTSVAEPDVENAILKRLGVK
jgi:hypothetical protein